MNCRSCRILHANWANTMLQHGADDPLHCHRTCSSRTRSASALARRAASSSRLRRSSASVRARSAAISAYRVAVGTHCLRDCGQSRVCTFGLCMCAYLCLQICAHYAARKGLAGNLTAGTRSRQTQQVPGASSLQHARSRPARARAACAPRPRSQRCDAAPPAAPASAPPAGGRPRTFTIALARSGAWTYNQQLASLEIVSNLY